jgi:hypothetical protein
VDPDFSLGLPDLAVQPRRLEEHGVIASGVRQQSSADPPEVPDLPACVVDDGGLLGGGHGS